MIYQTAAERSLPRFQGHAIFGAEYLTIHGLTHALLNSIILNDLE